MRISTKTYYGLKAMANLARDNEIVPIADLSEEERIPPAFLEKIMQQLHRHRLVESKKGALGGYKLIKKPGDIPISEIFSALGEAIEISPCYEENCPHHQGCRTADFWQRLEDNIYDNLSSITLGDLIS